MATHTTINFRVFGGQLQDIRGFGSGVGLIKYALENSFCPYFDIFPTGKVCLRGEKWQLGKHDWNKGIKKNNRGHVILGRLPREVRELMDSVDRALQRGSQGLRSTRTKRFRLRVITTTGKQLVKEYRDSRSWQLR